MRVPEAAPIVTAAQMRAAEEAVFAAGTPQIELMERAGAAVAREAARFAHGRPILVLAGPGNNGGDAYVAARLLRAAGLDVTVAAQGEPKAGAAAEMHALWSHGIVPLDQAEPRPVLVDGLFGTGLTRPLEHSVSFVVQHLVSKSDFSIAIDVPSGIETDNGADLGSASMTATLALGALKPAHVLGAGRSRCGHILLADIGIPIETRWRTLERPRLTAPAADAHKYSRGLVVVVEGAMPGAARLAARAALRGGAGYVVLAGEGATGLDAIVHRSLADLDGLLSDDRAGAFVLGPGLGRDDVARDRLEAVLGSPRPLVLDGDALSLLGSNASRLRDRSAPTILTPHEGEFARMFGEGKGSKIDRTLAAATATGATIVHKGGDTVIASPDGEVRVHSDAPSWLSTAGTGDVLAGLVGAQLAGGADPFTAAGTAVWLHSRAARLAGAAFAADDLPAQLPAAIGECL